MILVINSYFQLKKGSKRVYIHKMIVVGKGATQETFQSLNL